MRADDRYGIACLESAFGCVLFDGKIQLVIVTVDCCPGILADVAGWYGVFSDVEICHCHGLLSFNFDLFLRRRADADRSIGGLS